MHNDKLAGHKIRWDELYRAYHWKEKKTANWPYMIVGGAISIAAGYLLLMILGIE